MVDTQDLLTIAHFARTLGLTRWAIYHWLTLDDFTADCLVPIDGHYYIRVSAAHQWIARYRQRRFGASGAQSAQDNAQAFTPTQHTA